MIKMSSINREFTEFTTTATKTLLKKWICAASNFTALISSRLIRQMFFFFLELTDSQGLHQSSGNEKKVVAVSSRPRQNVKLGSFTL